MMTRDQRKHIDREIKRLSDATGIPEATIYQYIEADLAQIHAQTVSIPTARLATLEKLCDELNKTGRELQHAIAAKERALADLSTRVDRARVALLERQDQLMARQSDLTALQSRRANVDEDIRKTDRAADQTRFDIMRRRTGSHASTAVPNLVVRVALVIFTLIGIAIALFLILTRLN